MLVFSSGSLNLLGYTDSDFRLMLVTKSLLLKKVFTLGVGAMIWRSDRLSAISVAVI